MHQPPRLPVYRGRYATGGTPELVVEMGGIGVAEPAGDLRQREVGPQHVPRCMLQRAGTLESDGSDALCSKTALGRPRMHPQRDVQLGHLRPRESREKVAGIAHQARRVQDTREVLEV